MENWKSHWKNLFLRWGSSWRNKGQINIATKRINRGTSIIAILIELQWRTSAPVTSQWKAHLFLPSFLRTHFRHWERYQTPTVPPTENAARHNAPSLLIAAYGEIRLYYCSKMSTMHANLCKIRSSTIVTAFPTGKATVFRDHGHIWTTAKVGWQKHVWNRNCVQIFKIDESKFIWTF